MSFFGFSSSTNKVLRRNNSNSHLIYSYTSSPPSRKKHQSQCSLSFVIVCAMATMMIMYVMVMISLTRYTSAKSNATALPTNGVGSISNGVDNTALHVYNRDQRANRVPPNYAAEQKSGHAVEPQKLRDATTSAEKESKQDDRDHHHDNPHRRVLTAYLEEIDAPNWWFVKPLPNERSTTAQASKLHKRTYPNLSSCRKLPEQFPIDDSPVHQDPFLPWIHDVFPTENGKFIQFVAQNFRRCNTGTSAAEKALMEQRQPQLSLFQHVPVQRVQQQKHDGTMETRYQLSTNHHTADPDGIATRFICRFQPSGIETLSVFNVDYEWASYRKKHKRMFNEDGHRDNLFIHTSQLNFKCPVPAELQETIRDGSSVQNDYATLFVDLIPIRTPPRFGSPNRFLQTYYEEFMSDYDPFNATLEWGSNHILPRIEDSGRWENIPICKPSLMTYPLPHEKQVEHQVQVHSDSNNKPHRLISCLWASTGYATRGNRFAINDGQRRLLEWITYNKLIGFDHFYLYDNSGAFNDIEQDPSSSLQPIAALFPDDVTVINWPAQICNNNPNNVDSVGERSSQYAAESSCRLRFGPHTEWIGQFDIDEYLVPMGELESIHPLLDKLDDEGNKIISFGSWRAWPRRKFVNEPVTLHGREHCGRNWDCFELSIPMNHTMLQAYNCDRQKPGQKKSQMPAEKQLYRPDYVRQHFIHYSTITQFSELNRQDVEKLGFGWTKPFPDPLSRFGNEVTEGLMLHTKAVATQDTGGWKTACNASYPGKASCRLGTPFPSEEEIKRKNINLTLGDEGGWKFNCYVNHKIDDYWVPKLEDRLKPHVPEVAEKLRLSIN